MSAWRRKAIALFPEHREEIAQPKYRLFNLFFQLHMDADQAHTAAPADPIAAERLRRIHGFAEWCLHQGGELWDLAAIGFYEDLFASVAWERIVPWLSPFAVAQVEATWALGIGGEQRSRFEALVGARRQHLYRQHVFSTGEIESL